MTTNQDGTAVVIEHAIGTRGTVAIRLASAGLRLTATDGDRVVVRTAADRPLPEGVIVETTDERLSIHERQRGGLSLEHGRGVIELEIELPALAEVTIDTASGWIDVNGLRGGQQYRTVSGAIGLRAVGGRLDVGTVSGDVTIELAEAATVALKSVSGDVALSGAHLDRLQVHTTSGDVRIDSPLVGRSGNTIETLSGDVDLAVRDGIRVEARTLSGDLTSDLAHRTEGRMGRRTLIVGDGAIELGFRSVSGDLRIHGASADGSRPSAPAAPAATTPPPAAAPPPLEAAPPLAPSPAESEDAIEAERMTILRALEVGDLDVATAMEILAALDDASSAGRTASTEDHAHG